MAVLNFLVAGATEIVARSLELQARQDPATSTTTSSASPESSTSVIPTVASTLTSSSTSASPTTSAFPTNDSNETFQSSRDSTTSPLLFFVALGFGVVFTNLWIIVGVKYCFRYNARNRQLRMEAAGDPVALGDMPRPHRRRREKKLMTMDEVNEKFPMQKYKNWVAARAQEGLPTMGGISAPPSRANSVRSVEAIAPEVPSKERDSDDQRPVTSASMKRTSNDVMSGNAPDVASKSTPADRNEPASSSINAGHGAETSATTVQYSNLQRVDSEDDNDDEHINAALPPEYLGTSGDACAICIETLEDDDDVRGLTCGHAFHAVCLDPWLTSRRACCPLCKADYYTPKPRPPPADHNATVDSNGNTVWVQAGDSRRTADSARGFQPFMTFLPRRLRRSRETSQPMQEEQQVQSQRPATATHSTPRSPAQQQQPSPTAPVAETRDAGSGGFLSGFRPSLPRVRLPQLPPLRRNRQAEGAATTTPGASTTVTPSQLEAATRPAAATATA